jgi:hypothetical protein
MKRTQRPDLDPEPAGVSTLDLLLLIAGFACGWVMQQRALFTVGQAYYILPLSGGLFQSLLGMAWLRWLWASAVGLAFLIVGRRFRYDCRKRPAEWLAVALAIVLIESSYPAVRTGPTVAGAGGGETIWIEPNGEFDSASAAKIFRKWGYRPFDGRLTFDLSWPTNGESWQELVWIALPLAAAAVMMTIFAWCLRARLGPGWFAVMLVMIAVLITFGPIRFAEAMSTEVCWAAPNPAYQPRSGEKPWSWPALAAYYDARAWAGYSLRALALLMIAMLVARDVWSRWRAWLWTEWAAAACGAVFAGCWVYDEFVARPALDRTVRVVLLGAWLVVLALVVAGGIWFWSRLGRRFGIGDGGGESC